MSEEELEPAETYYAKTRAATCIQSTFRGYLYRYNVSQQDIQDFCAKKIQRAWRRHYISQKLQSCREILARRVIRKAVARYLERKEATGKLNNLKQFEDVLTFFPAKSKPFSGKPAPFVMELPAYHIPSARTVLLHVWERLKGFIVKAGTILFLACVVMWFLSGFGFGPDGFGLVEDSNDSILAVIGGAIAPVFAPLGFGQWQPVAASLSGFTAKEAIVSTMGVLANVSEDLAEDSVAVAGAIGAWFPTAIAAFSFLLFNLLDSPCLAAIATMAQQMQSRKWFWFAIIFQNVFAYVVSLIVYQIGLLALTGVFGTWTAVAFILLAVMLFMLFRPDPYKNEKVYSRRSVNAATV